MSAISAPTVQFSAEFLAFAQAALDLDKSQRIAPAIAAVPTVKPITTTRQAVAAQNADKIATDAPYGFKSDGTPRKRPVPTWLNNVKSDAKPRKPRKSAPTIVEAPTIVQSDAPAWTLEPTKQGSSQHTRILAAELALFGAKSRKLTLDITAKFATKGEASAHYQSLAPRVAAKGLDIRNGSANWKLAAAIIAKRAK